MSRGMHELLTWVDRRLDAMLKRPRAWGGPEAVETQVLLLLQFRGLIARPRTEKVPSQVLESYFEYLERTFPERPNHPLHRLVGEDPTSEGLAAELEKAVMTVRAAFQPENPFEHHRLAIRLQYREGAIPRTSSVTGYFEEFRRATRAVARRPEASTGRVAREVEQATDFELVDVRVVPKNGTPAEAWILMGHGFGQGDLIANDAVQDALTGMAELVDWAGRDDALDALAIDNPTRRSTLAIQTRRLLPRGDVHEVSVGGAMMGRSRPVVFRKGLETRLMQAVDTDSPATAFEATDEIHAYDRDRGRLVLGKQRLDCFVLPEFAPSVLVVGQKAKVRGHRYTQNGRPFVIIEDPIEGPAVPSDGEDTDAEPALN